MPTKRYVNRQYCQANGRWAAVQFDSSVDGALRVRASRPFKQWNPTEKPCDQVSQSPATTTSSSGL